MGKYGPKRQSIRRSLCGDMRHYIALQTRDITVPDDPNNPSYTESFTTTYQVFSAIYTKKGDEFFDGVNLSTFESHNFIIRRINGLTEEKWILYRGFLYDIIDIEDYDERQLFMLIRTKLRGDATLKANQA